MTTDQWQRVKELFDAALAQPFAMRSPWLSEVCQDAEIRHEVISLLASYEQAGEFIQQPLAGIDVADLAPDSRQGQVLGAWSLLEEIGRGGMGTVWRAERADGAFEKKVALKIVSRGMDTDLILRRFHQERQILASLNHPNITALLDGGTSADGLPYFVMELVEGSPITTFCRERALPLRARLELFCTVCDGVEHAHRNHVLHRDLKPSNILVTAEGVPKLLDFGIAKLLMAVPGAEATLAIGPLHALTPEYASPEQVRAEPLAESSDVYSLGVLLYELLADRRPYEFETRSSEEIATVVCEREPVKPSTAARQAQLKGDLDSIVMTALRKEARFRYGTVADLASDIGSYLRGRPVGAVRQTLGYRTGKFLRRQRARITVALVLLLVLGVSALWQSAQRKLPTQSASYRRSPVAEANDYYERAIAVEKADFDLPRMIRLLQRAVELDPNFTAGRSRYGFYQLLMIDNGISNDPAWLDRAESELKRVEREDPSSALNHAFLAALNFHRRHWDEVEKHVNTAVRLNPADVDAEIWRINVLTMRGDWPRAIQLCQEALHRDPAWFPARMNLVFIYRFSGDLESCIRESQKTLDQNARLLYPITGLATARLDLGQLALARQTLNLARPDERGNYRLRLTWALLLACEGNAEGARREMDPDVTRWAEMTPYSLILAAEIYSVVGDTENALAWLEKSVQGGDRRKSWFLRDPHLANVRRHPRFQQILDSIPTIRAGSRFKIGEPLRPRFSR